MAAADPDTKLPRTVRLADYAPPEFLLDSVDLVFELGDVSTRVKSRLALRRNPAAAAGPLRLDGCALELVALSLDGEALGANRYQVDDEGLTIAEAPDEFVLDVETAIRPQDNTELQGLYKSGGNFCTQCEPEGFRRITFFPDRPDVMARYTVTIVADRARYPVLLANGNLVDQDEGAPGRHWAQWVDPHPKPSYLFALVAGDLVPVEDRFTTRSGRDVELAIWVRRGDERKCGHAMASLKAAMAWDEERFGLEYDLDLFNIVAVSDFNMGAMENKGLNIFNTRFVLAAPETATDNDYQGIERVIGHEYFHNWTGDRVTCRDWFQLSLKEGLTVFRDQEFMSDRHSRAVKRINDVRLLRATQFPEDGGPLAHPVRPDSYIEIDNFYTSTVYNKGAELVRMIQTLIGDEAFRRGFDLYIERHDNQAVTVEDFVAAMEDAAGVDLGQFKRWYVQAGTPELETSGRYYPGSRTYELTITQRTLATPGQNTKSELLVPVSVGLIGPDGTELETRLDGVDDPPGPTHTLQVTAASETFRFLDVPAAPEPSLLRNFSAPVKLRGVPLERLKFLARFDTDPFARWDAVQRVCIASLLELAAAWRRGAALSLDPDLRETVRKLLADAEADPAFAAEGLTLPSETMLAEELPIVDVESIHAAHGFARAALGAELQVEFEALYDRLTDLSDYRPEPLAMGRRALRNLCLSYLSAAGSEAGIARAKAQFDERRNMTDVLAALAVLNEHDRPERSTALAAFYDQWSAEDLVIDKWFALQAMSPLPGALDEVQALARHPAFDIRNPNRVRALLGAFTQGNPLHFHAPDGRGYRFLADHVLKLDALNAQMAARTVQPLGTWRRHDAVRQALMRAQLERILAAEGLSKNTYEMASKSLG